MERPGGVPPFLSVASPWVVAPCPLSVSLRRTPPALRPLRPGLWPSPPLFSASIELLFADDRLRRQPPTRSRERNATSISLLGPSPLKAGRGSGRGGCPVKSPPLKATT